MSDPRPEQYLAGLASPDEATRLASVKACARAADASALGPLRKLAGEDPSGEVRYQARIALSAIRRAQASGAVRSPAAFPEDPSADDLRQLMGSPDPALRAWAVREAVQHDDADELAAVAVARIPFETDSDVRAQLVTSLSEMGGPELRPHVAVFLRDPDARVRANAVEAVETLGDVKLLELVAKALQDPDHRVKLNAIAVLDRAGRLDLKSCCEKLLADADYWLRDAAMYTLAHANRADAVPLLARGLADPHDPVRAKARAGLEALADAGVAAARDALGRPPPPWRLERPWDVDLTALVPDEGHIPLIADRLRTERDPAVIARLLGILGNLGNPVVVPLVAEHVRAPQPDVARMAAVVLRRLGAEHLVPRDSSW